LQLPGTLNDLERSFQSPDQATILRQYIVAYETNYSDRLSYFYCRVRM